MLLSMWMWDFPPYDMVFTCYLHSEVLKKHKKRDRISGKELTHWLIDKQHKSAHVHVLINYIEVKPYL